MSEIIYDFRAIGGKLRRQRLCDWWQPAELEPEPQAAEPRESETPLTFGLEI